MSPDNEDARYPVVVEVDEDGVYIVSCPMFRGCRSYGNTIEEALANIREAIAACLDEEPTGEATRFVGLREVRVPSDA